MTPNLSRGCWRLWLFFNCIWVICCAWQVWDARAQIKKAEALEAYYTKASAEAHRLESHDSISPIVSTHLAEQVDANAKITTQQHEREEKFFRLMWMIPLITLIFARGIPWVWEGFIQKG